MVFKMLYNFIRHWSARAETNKMKREMKAVCKTIAMGKGDLKGT